MGNLTNWTTVTNWTGILQSANTQTDGYFWLMILWGIFLLVLMITSVIGLEVALLIASFIGLVFGMFLAYSELISWGWVVTQLGIMIATILYISWTSNKR